MNKFTEYLEMQIEGCKRTKAPYRDKIIYQLVLDEYKKQLTLTDVVGTCCDETRKVNQFLQRPSKYCMTCSKEMK